MRTVIVAVAMGVGLLVTAVPSSAWGQEESEAAVLLRKARRSLEAGDFERSIKVAQLVLEDKEALPQSMQAEAYRLLGLAQLYLGRERQALASYEELLRIQPDYQLPSTAPPKVQEIFKRIVEEIAGRRLPPVTLSVAQIPDSVGDRPLTLRAQILNMAPFLKAKLYYRGPASREFSSADFARVQTEGDVYAATIPAYDLRSEEQPYPLEYYVEVADAARRRLAGQGTADQPERFKVLPAAPNGATKPWYKKPLVWGIVGGVVLTSVVVGIAVANSNRAGP